MKTSIKYIAYIIGGLSTAYLLFMYVISSYIGSSSIETWDAMQKQAFNCPEGTEVTYRGWSENGRMRYCEPSKNGAWEAWMSGYKWVQGTYINGKEHGEWLWFNKDGSVSKRIIYVYGVEQKVGEI
ncbi:MAG: hypothetical protein HND59_05765 [Pseudomonadota bacterium]|nr:MAG: hypothetical protein HND59_05765 [Pseudomonadota bacterium]